MKEDVILAMLVCSLYLQDVPMGLKEKVILCILIMKYFDLYVKTESDLIWVNNQIKKMESEMKSDEQLHTVEQLDIRGSNSIEWDRPSDE